MPRLRSEAHQRNDDGHAEAGAQQHDLTTVFVGKLSPDGLKNKRSREIGGKNHPGPHSDRMLSLHVQIPR
ncbi:hypothetical protein D3C81_1825330 [compost metagenome]